MRVLEIEPESSGRAIGAPTSKPSPVPEEMFVSKTQPFRTLITTLTTTMASCHELFFSLSLPMLDKEDYAWI